MSVYRNIWHIGSYSEGLGEVCGLILFACISRQREIYRILPNKGTVQYSTVQYSTVQYSIVRLKKGQWKNVNNSILISVLKNLFL